MIEYIIFGMAAGGIPAFLLGYLISENKNLKKHKKE